MYGFIHAWNEFIINTFTDQTQQNLMAWPAAEPDATRDVPGAADGRADPTAIPVVSLIQRTIATGLTAGAVKGR